MLFQDRFLDGYSSWIKIRVGWTLPYNSWKRDSGYRRKRRSKISPTSDSYQGKRVLEATLLQSYRSFGAWHQRWVKFYIHRYNQLFEQFEQVTHFRRWQGTENPIGNWGKYTIQHGAKTWKMEEIIQILRRVDKARTRCWNKPSLQGQTCTPKSQSSTRWTQ